MSTETPKWYAFSMVGGDIVRADGTCAGYTTLDFQSHYRALEARARWAEDVARPALLAYLPVIVDAEWAEEVKQALAANPQPEKES